MGKGEVEQCENAQHPDNHGKWFARPDHFAKTFPFKETIIQFYFFLQDRPKQPTGIFKKIGKKEGNRRPLERSGTRLSEGKSHDKRERDAKGVRREGRRRTEGG